MRVNVRTLFVGDVHACVKELSQLVELANPDRIILLGDLFSKGPSPNRLWKMIQAYKMEAVLGNHDLYVLNNNYQKLPKAAIRWLKTLPLFIRGDGWLAVHAGINPSGPTLKEEAIFIRRWPSKRAGNPFWWQMYKGEDLVLYGHDARRQLQDHRPYTLGLDTGCVYGFHLSGYLLEEDRILMVPARKAYCPV